MPNLTPWSIYLVADRRGNLVITGSHMGVPSLEICLSYYPFVRVCTSPVSIHMLEGVRH